MNTEIEIKRRVGRHGTVLIDVCDPVHAEAISELTCCKTLLPRHIESLKKLGFTIYDCDEAIAHL